MNTIDFERINRNRKKIFTFTLIWMVLLGGLLFPIKFVQFIPIYIGMLVAYFYIAYMLFGLYEKLYIYFSYALYFDFYQSIVVSLNRLA